MDLGLKNKIIFITGASRGIGNAIAKGFVKEGATVYDTIRDESRNKELEENGIHPVILDVRNFNQIEEKLLPIFEKHNKIDCLINNAGISTNTPASLFKEKEVKEIIETNFEAVFLYLKNIINYKKI